MKRYEWLLFDVDHTILDYTADERAALKELFAEFGVSVDETALTRCQHLSEKAWTDAGLYDVQNPEIQRVWHKLYRSHVPNIFRLFFDEIGVTGKDLTAIATRFLTLLERSGLEMPHAKQTLAELKAKGYKIALATNGVSSIQRARLESLSGRYEKAFISEEVGAIKPQKEFFEHVLLETGAKKENCLMIGDSLSSDMAGAKNAGIDACFYNRKNAENLPNFLALTVVDLRQLTTIL